MNIKEKIDKDQWDKFVSSEKPDTFLHSWNWGEFNRMMGDKIFRLAIFDDNDNDLAGVALIIKISAKRGKFLFCPHGPIIKSSKFKVQSSKFWNAFLNYLNKLAVKENVDFVRISSLLENNKENTEIFKSAGFRDAPIHMIHPELSWILDISKTEEEILSGMRKTTRNLIRRAEKDAVRVSESRDAKDIGKFCELHSKTVSRHGFVPFSESYLKNQFAAFIRDDQISIFFAEHNNQVLSSAIIVFYGNSAFYHHGASLASKIPASHLLLWKAIISAKKRNCQKFNFWGIAPEGKPDHPWAGLTLFKRGFGGRAEEYMHAKDMLISGKYWVNWLVESFRRKKRGY